MEESSQVQSAARFIDPLLDKLRRHLKRVVFPEGEDLRVLRVAERFVKEEAVVPILLGDKERIRAMADAEGISLKFVKLLDPAKASDLGLFTRRYAKIEKYRSGQDIDAESLVVRPHYFASLMCQYGQADALVGGNQVLPGTLFRGLQQCIKPMPEINRMFGVMAMSAPHLDHFGRDGLLLMADCAMISEPTVDELATIALETGRLARHFLGRDPVIAMLSHSTKGSSKTPSSTRMAAATVLAREKAAAEGLNFHIRGEVQADVALDPVASEVKLPGGGKREAADVLVFPNLDSGHIAVKLLQYCSGAMNFGQMICGLARPAAQVPRTVSEESLFGTAAAVAVEAIKFHEMYPDGEV